VSAKLDPNQQTWMQDERTRAVMSALKAEGGEARFVGGAVRNALLGEPVGDIDIATPLVPDEVIRLLKGAGLGAVPTGIAHGTVTAVADGKPFEVTTLRRDVETFGRHAVVAFTTDWQEDAARRDFTMNALYADESGMVFDSVGGIADLHARRVRFVGDAGTRIREDYLRILRLFRFHAWYGRGEIDRAAFDASVAEKAGLKLLSGERVQSELFRLLGAEDPIPALSQMERAGILAEILPSDLQLIRIARLIAIKDVNALDPQPVLRLAALLPDSPETARNLASVLKLSNADRDRLIDAVTVDERIGATMSLAQARELLYRLGRDCFRDQLLLRWATSGAEPDDQRWRALLVLSEQWKKPVFPLDGRDAMAEGIEEGPKIGEVLRDIEQTWIEADFELDRLTLLERLREVARK
jgi:poly(A) polymerase